MNIATLVSRLETVSGLSGKVAVGSPMQTDSLATGPAVWISDITEGAGSNQRTNAPALQRVEVRVGITASAATLSALMTLRDSIRAKLVDYQMSEPGDPMTYRTGRMEFLDPGIVLWRDEFSYSYYYDMLEVA